MAKNKKAVKNGVEIVNGWPNPYSLTKEKLAGIIMELQGILWAGEDGKPDMESQWSADEIEQVADTLAKAGMKPKECAMRQVRKALVERGLIQ